MTTTSFLGLKKPADSDSINVSDLNYNADKIDAFAAASISASVMSATDEGNPTYDTPTACAGMLITATSADNSAVGLRIFAGTSGEIFMQSKDSHGWGDWAEVVSISE